MPHPVKSVGHIDFDNHSLVSSFPAGVYGFLDQNDVVNHFPFFNKTALVWGDELMKERLNSVGYDFSDEFVGDIA
jgi:hypothetical protein